MNNLSSLQLRNKSRIGIIGGGPAGSFFAYFLLEIAHRLDLNFTVDIYEPKDFKRSGPQGCNKCGGIISESLVQILAAEGINLPPTIVQRGIDSYVMHTDVGSVRIETPLHEKRIGAVHRGCGPRELVGIKWDSFDGFLLDRAMEKGANVIRDKVETISFTKELPEVKVNNGKDSWHTHELIVIACGINSSSLKNFQQSSPNYQPPTSAKAFIKEYNLGEEKIEQYLGSSMHVFLLNIPKLEFAAIIPKGANVTLCMLGENIDHNLVRDFVNSPEVKNCFPQDFTLDKGACQCWPQINVKGAENPFGDRFVFIGDSSYTRLYKDGIGAAYVTAKAAANTAVLHGISMGDFKKHYWVSCRRISIDNAFGKLIFMITGIFQNLRFTRRAIIYTVASEQRKKGGKKTMSNVLWDMFTGSSPYRTIFFNTLNPIFLGRFLWNLTLSVLSYSKYES